MIFNVVSNFNKRVGGRTFSKMYVEAPDTDTAKRMALAALVGYPVMFQTSSPVRGGIASGMYLLTMEYLQSDPVWSAEYTRLGGVL